jgi:hypothetical protein
MSALHKQNSLEIPLPEIQEHADSEVAWLKSHHADDLLKLMEEFRALVYSERTSLEEARSFTGRLLVGLEPQSLNGFSALGECAGESPALLVVDDF